jgi:putative copper export protein
VTGWLIVRWLHLLAMAFFVGGQLMLAAVLVPVARGTDTMRAAARRFGQGTLVAVGVLLVTGIPLASHYGVWDDSRLHAKLTLVVIVGALVLAHLRRPANHALDGLIFLGSLAIVYLGVALSYN